MTEARILKNWIKARLNGYNEGVRKGIPRGKILPIPKHKYYCALLHLAYTKKFPLEQIAKETGTHIKLVIKWRGESKFLELVGQLAREYADYFIRYILIEKQPFRIDEVAYYSLLLWDRILKQLSDLRDKLKTDKESYLLLNKLILDFFQVRLEYWGSKEEKMLFYEKLQKAVPEALKTLQGIFNKAIEERNWEKAKELYNDLSLRYGKLSEGFHIYRKRFLECGLI